MIPLKNTPIICPDAFNASKGFGDVCFSFVDRPIISNKIEMGVSEQNGGQENGHGWFHMEHFNEYDF